MADADMGDAAQGLIDQPAGATAQTPSMNLDDAGETPPPVASPAPEPPPAPPPRAPSPMPRVLRQLADHNARGFNDPFPAGVVDPRPRVRRAVLALAAPPGG